MSLGSVVASAPGKLVLAGEYAVLEAGEPAVVAAVEKRLIARVAPCETYRFSSESLGISGVQASYGATRYVIESAPAPGVAFAESAVNVTLGYLNELGVVIPPFALDLEGSLESASGLKYGFGSSAAVSVAIVGGILGAFGVTPEASKVFKLATIAHHRSQGSGSGVDIAASTYGGALRYVGFDSDWLGERMEQGSPLLSLLETEWPLLGIEPLGWPEGLVFGVGWTGQAASTAHLIRAVRESSARRAPGYARFIVTSREAVNRLAAALRDRDADSAIRALRQSREALRILQAASSVVIETPALEAFADAAESCGGGGKSSGAGGGDCGVGLFHAPTELKCATDRWRTHDVEPLSVAIAPAGLELRR